MVAVAVEGQVIYLTPDFHPRYQRQVQGDQAIEVGFETPISRPDKGERVLEGRFGLFDMPEGLMLRDFVAQTNFMFPSDMNSWHRDVAVADFDSCSLSAERSFPTYIQASKWLSKKKGLLLR